MAFFHIKRTKIILFSFFTFFLFLLFLEYLVSTFWPVDPHIICLEPHNGLKVTLKPNFSTHLTEPRRNEFEHSFKTNKKRLRGAEVDYKKETDEYRILMLGDSMTFGWGVSNDGTFSNHLERFLNNSKQFAFPKFKVINGGIPATSTLDQLLFLEKEGIKYKPDLIVLCLYDNDWWANFVGYSDFEKISYDESKNEMVTSGFYYSEYNEPLTLSIIRSLFSFIPFYDFLNSRSHLLNSVKLRIQALSQEYQIKENALNQLVVKNNIARAKWVDRDNNAKIILSSNSNPTSIAKFAVTLSLIRKMSSYALKNNSEFMVVVIPTREEIIGNSPIRNYPSFLGKNQNKIETLILAHSFLSVEKKDVSYLWYPFESHISTTGHLAAGFNIALSIIDSFHKDKKFNKQKINESYNKLMVLVKNKLSKRLHSIKDYAELHYYKCSVLALNNLKKNIKEIIPELTLSVNLKNYHREPQNLSYIKLGKSNMLLGKFDEAIILLNQLESPGSLMLANVHAQLGLCYLMKKEIVKAEEYFMSSSKLNSAQSLGYYGMGLTSMEKGLYYDALGYLKNALLYDPSNPEMNKALKYAENKIKQKKKGL
ncbi:MAG: hypothetical protein QGG95_05785 [Nitrospinota bacterium]|nr:hypothetical protein [Nitrospinota bacterium]